MCACCSVWPRQESAASQFHLQPVTFICATVWPKRNTFDQLKEIQLILWQKYISNDKRNPVEFFRGCSRVPFYTFARTFIRATLCLASSLRLIRHLLSGPLTGPSQKNTVLIDTITEQKIEIQIPRNTCCQLSPAQTPWRHCSPDTICSKMINIRSSL